MKTFFDWLWNINEAGEPFDRNILKGLHQRMTTPTADGPALRAGGMYFNTTPEEMQHFTQMVQHTKERLIQELKGPLSQAWQIFKSWEDKNKSVQIRFSVGKLPSCIKDGGPGTQIQEGPKDPSGRYSSIIVPSELYRVLYWRQQVKDAEQAIYDNNLSQIRSLLPLFSHFYK